MISQYAYLGAILDDAKLLDEHPLKESDFNEALQPIFHTMLSLHESGMPVELESLMSECKQEFVAHSSNIIDHAASPSSAGFYAKKIKLNSERRSIEDIKLLIDDRPVKEIKEDIEGVLQSCDRTDKRISIKDIVRESMKQLDNPVDGLMSGLVDLDNIWLGGRPSDFIVAAGRPGMGKTSFGLQIIDHNAERGALCHVFTLEMSKEQIVQRLAATKAAVNLEHISKRTASHEEVARFVEAMGRVAEMPIIIDDTPALNIQDFKSRIRREKPDLVLCDYLQLFTTSKPENRFQEISHISREMKATAKANNVPVIALAQLSRALEQRTNRRPIMSDLRESGQIEQDADAIMFLYREVVYCENCKQGLPCDKGHERDVEIIMEKQRGGRTGTKFAEYRQEYTKFSDVSRY